MKNKLFPAWIMANIFTDIVGRDAKHKRVVSGVQYFNEGPRK